MLFQPWRNVNELLQRQSEEDKEKQIQNRLELFPMAIFPRGVEGSGRRGLEQESDLASDIDAERA